MPVEWTLVEERFDYEDREQEQGTLQATQYRRKSKGLGGDARSGILAVQQLK